MGLSPYLSAKGMSIKLPRASVPQPMAYVLFLQLWSASHVRGWLCRTKGNLHEDRCEAQLSLHWAPGWSCCIDLGKSHEGIERGQAKVQVLPPFRPVQRVIGITCRPGLQNDLGVGLVVPQESFQPYGSRRPLRVTGHVSSNGGSHREEGSQTAHGRVEYAVLCNTPLRSKRLSAIHLHLLHCTAVSSAPRPRQYYIPIQFHDQDSRTDYLDRPDRYQLPREIP